MFDDRRLNESYELLARLSEPLKKSARKIVGREHEKMQLMAAMRRPELCNALLLAPAGAGKLLPLDTPIPTPSGWTTMGDLQPGDQVLGRDGKPTTVSYVSDVDEEPELYELMLRVRYWTNREFDRNDDGHETRASFGTRRITACADHQWLVSPVEYPGAEIAMTTRQLVESPEQFFIRPGAPLDLPEVELEMPAFELGTAVTASVDHTSEQEAALVGMLEQVLRGSRAQRTDVLRGLLSNWGGYSDGDGWHRRELRPGIVSSSELRERTWSAIGELLCTLGIQAVLPVVDAHQPDALVDFLTDLYLDLPNSTVECPWATETRMEITDISPASTRPGKCIQVDNDDHVYLAGEDFIPTHNTSLVQGVMETDVERLYLEADPSRMIAQSGSAENMASMLKQFFDEAERFVRDEERELVLFIDEFHQIIQLSDAAVEAIKPVLAASGTRGIRVIAATTYDEFHKHIAANQPLVERLQRINLDPPDEETTVKILQGMAERYGVAEQFYDDHIFRLIYEYTERYVPASAQPRKSILVLDAMCGWHEVTKRPMDRDLLADVLMESVNVNLAVRVDPTRIKQQLDSKVFSQDLATSVVARRLQLVVADLNDKTKPTVSMLLTGSSGVGKTELVKQMSRLMFGDDQRHLIRFDMSEFAEDSSLDMFRSELTKRVWDIPYSVLLFDEIEKASAKVTRLLLQVLDDGRLSDDNNRTVSFLNTYIVLTTNAGSEIYRTIGEYDASDTGSGENLAQYEKLIRQSIMSTTGDNRFPPELLGRLDAIVPFQPLSLATQEKILLNKLRQLCQEVFVKHNVRVVPDRRVLQYLSQDKGDSDSNAGGARGAVAKLTSEVTTEIAAFINAHPAERRIRVDIEGELVSDHKDMLTSDARVVVSAMR